MRRKLRSLLFWLHLGLGLGFGIFILNMAISGILIAYQKPILAWAEQAQRTVPIPGPAPRLGLEDLVRRVQSQEPNLPLSGLVGYANPQAAVMFYVGRDNHVLYANPFTGEVLGQGNLTLRTFFQGITSWHRWLALEGKERFWGQTLTGASSLAYFSLLLSGLYLWLPKTWSLLRLKQGAVLNLKVSGKARDWNWHNVIGLWLAPFLLLVTLTGIIMSYPWAGNLLFQLTGNPVPENRREGKRLENQPATPPSPLQLAGMDLLWVKAQGQVVGWHSLSLRLSEVQASSAKFSIDTGESLRPDQVSQLTLDRATGETLRWQTYAQQNTGQKLRSWVRPLHTGEAGGWLGESIAVLASLGTSLLVFTGFSLAWRRLVVPSKTPFLASTSSP